MRAGRILLGSLCAIFGALVAVAAAAGPPQADFYVAPNGKNHWTGKLPEPKADGSDGPLATLAGARDAVRRARLPGSSSHSIRVLIRGGVYRLAQPVVFSPEDSGSKGAPITYAAYPGERPVLSGGVPITGWRKGDGPLWTAGLGKKNQNSFSLQDAAQPEDDKGKRGLTPFSLFVNGRRCIPARIPNESERWFFSAGPVEPFKDRNAARRDPKTKVAFRFHADEINPWSSLQDAVLVYYHCWTTSRHGILAVEPEQKIVRLANPSGWPMGWWGKDERYYVEFVREGLDAPGEWYPDRQTGVLSYYPRPGEDMTRAEVVAPACEELLRLEGDAAGGKPVVGLRFEGLSFQYTDWTMPRQGGVDGQAAAFLKTAAVHAVGAHDCVFQRCEIGHTGGYGLWLGRGCRNNRVVQCHLHDLGAGGVRLGEMSLPSNEQERAAGNLVENCFIHEGGKVFHAGVGVWIGKTSGNMVQHCEICDFLYSGVSVGWTWGYAPSEARDNLVAYNHIHHLGWGQLSDMGGIYTLGISPGTRLLGNLIHDIWAFSYGGWGLYTDEGSTGIVLENNVVYRVKDACFHQHYGKENTLTNNILAFAYTYGQLRRSRQEEHRSFTFERNIVYYNQAELLGGNWSNGRFLLDSNVYWNAAGKTPSFPGGLGLRQWQEKGQDAHSVIADPKFVDASNGDFRLKDDSPALKLGFRPIDTTRAGLTGPPEWTELPKKVQRPEMKMGE